MASSWYQHVSSSNNATNIHEPLFNPTPSLLVFVPFLGLHVRATADTILYERLAFQAWQRLAHEAYAQNASVRLFGLVESAKQCDAFVDLASSTDGMPVNFFTCLFLPPRCLHPDYDNLPMVDCLFDVAKIHALPSELLLYSNGDITFAGDLLGALSSIMIQIQEEALVVRNQTKLVMVGRRTDVPIPPHFGNNDGTLDGLFQAATRTGTLHQDSGVDYFAFSQSAFPPSSSSSSSSPFPPFLVGRYRWDNALLASFLLDPEVITIDMTASVLAIHPGVHQVSDADHHLQRLGAPYNEQLAHRHYGYGYTLGRIDNTDWFLQLDAARPGQYTTVSRQSKPDDDLLCALSRVKKLSAKTDVIGNEEHLLGFLLLVTVTTPYEIPLAAAWARRHHTPCLGEPPGFLFLTRDENTYLELSLHAPNAAILDEKASQTRCLAEEEEEEQGVVRPLCWSTFDRLLHYKVATAIVGISHAESMSGLDLENSHDSWISRLMAELTQGHCVIVVPDTMQGHGQEKFMAIKPTAAAMTFWDEYRDKSHILGHRRVAIASSDSPLLDNGTICFLCGKH